MAERTDLQARSWQQLDWTTDEATIGSLGWLFDYAVGEAESAMDWYRSAKRSKRRGARRIRIVAVIVATLAGILPLLSQIVGSRVIPPALASIALALGVALVALDRFFGFSRAWMRYVTTDLRIQQLLHEFRLDWEVARIGVGKEGIEEQLALAMVARVRDFISAIRTAIREETNEWIRDFTESLGALEKHLKSSAD